MVIVGGSVLLIGVPVVRGDVEGGKELAGIFSGWIAAIVGFYFLQGQAQQAAAAAEDAVRRKSAALIKEQEEDIHALTAHNDRLKQELQKALNRHPDYKEDEES